MQLKCAPVVSKVKKPALVLCELPRAKCEAIRKAHKLVQGSFPYKLKKFLMSYIGTE